MVGGDGQGGVVAQQADDVQVGQPRLDHHDVCALRLIQPRLPQSLPVVGWVLLVGALVGGDHAPQHACQVQQPPFELTDLSAWLIDLGELC